MLDARQLQNCGADIHDRGEGLDQGASLFSLVGFGIVDDLGRLGHFAY